MIKFFRKIRQTLLSESKFSKYFIYAIGEIVLVVIGILIALSINNWNTERKNRFLEQDILLDLLEEYESNLAQLDQKISMRNDIINDSKDILEYIDDAHYDVNIDTLIKKLRLLKFDPTFDPIQNDLISSGNIRLIQNKNLKKLLSNWTSDVQSLQEMEIQWQTLKTDLNIPYQIDLGILRDMVDGQFSHGITPTYIIENKINSKIIIGGSKNTPKAKEILTDPKLESIIANAIVQNHSTNIQSLALRKRIKKILNLINKEIQ